MTTIKGDPNQFPKYGQSNCDQTTLTADMKKAIRERADAQLSEEVIVPSK